MRSILLFTAMLLSETSSAATNLTAPVWERHPSKPEPDVPSGIQPDSRSHPFARRYRAVLGAALARRPNFAGHYSVVSWGCGTGCAMSAIVDHRTGKVFVPKPIEILGFSDPPCDFDPLDFRDDSRVLRHVDPYSRAGRVLVIDYEWTGTDLRRLGVQDVSVSRWCEHFRR